MTAFFGALIGSVIGCVSVMILACVWISKDCGPIEYEQTGK